MKSCLKRWVFVFIALWAPYDYAAVNTAVAYDQELGNQQETASEDKFLIRTVGEAVVALIIAPEVDELVSGISETFVKNGWRKAIPADDDTLVDIVCQLDSQEYTITAQCKPELSIEVDGRLIIMPSSYGSILFDKQVVNLLGIDNFRQSVAQLVLIQESDAEDAAEARLRVLLE